MSQFINEILKGIDDLEILSKEMTDIPALDGLVKEYTEYRNKYDATIPYISEESLGSELKNALVFIPPKIRLGMLSRYSKMLDTSFQYFTPNNLQDYPTPVIDNPPEEDTTTEHKRCEKEIEESKHYLIKWIVYGFIGLSVLSVLSIIYNSRSTQTDGHSSLIGLLSNFVEILKVLIGI